jgi:hypothetical protein
VGCRHDNAWPAGYKHVKWRALTSEEQQGRTLPPSSLHAEQTPAPVHIVRVMARDIDLVLRASEALAGDAQEQHKGGEEQKGSDSAADDAVKSGNRKRRRLAGVGSDPPPVRRRSSSGFVHTGAWVGPRFSAKHWAALFGDQ